MVENGWNLPWTFAEFSLARSDLACMNNIEDTINVVINNPLFLRLKDVVENNSYHNYERVYDHLIKTKDIAQREIKGGFITNSEAKKLFMEFINEDFHRMKKGDIIILTALLHDIGKAKSKLVIDPLGITSCPNHEYLGSTIVGEILKNLNLDPLIIEQISNVVKLHDTFGETYFRNKTDWTMDFLINDVKSRAENLYKEAMFNIYCDCFTAEPFQFSKEMIVKIFNEPNLYIEREYVIT